MSQDAMPNPVDLFTRASSHAKSVLAGVKQEQLSSATPCSEWTVRDLINHLISGAENARAALTGHPEQIKFGSSDSSYSSENDITRLSAGYNLRVSEAIEAAAKPGAMEFTMPGPAGDMTSGQFLAATFMDQLIHSWDLAKASGQNARLDPDLTEMCYQMCVPGMADMGRNMGVVGPAVPVADSASTQDKLMAYMGRQP